MSASYFKQGVIRKIRYDRVKIMFPQGVLRFRTRLLGSKIPYPLPVTPYKRQNNVLHDAVIRNDLEVIQKIKKDGLYPLLLEKSWVNTPLTLAIKQGNWPAVTLLLEMMKTHLSARECEQVFSERDSMGMLPLSYALFLRAPDHIIASCLQYTSKKTYYSDAMYDLCTEGLDDDDDKSMFHVTEEGYQHKLSGGGFNLYEQSPMALYSEQMRSSPKAAVNFNSPVSSSNSC